MVATHSYGFKPATNFVREVAAMLFVCKKTVYV